LFLGHEEEKEGEAAAVPLLAKHEQNPPGAEQPFTQCGGGEEQGNASVPCAKLPVSLYT